MPDETNGAQLSADQVRKVARLARLALTDEQVEAYRGRLSAVLTYMQRLAEIDLEGVEPMSHPIGATNRLDLDEPAGTLDIEALMKIAPDKLQPYIKVPKVLEDRTG